jgi:hypothetical protein
MIIRLHKLFGRAEGYIVGDGIWVLFGATTDRFFFSKCHNSGSRKVLCARELMGKDMIFD